MKESSANHAEEAWTDEKCPVRGRHAVIALCAILFFVLATIGIYLFGWWQAYRRLQDNNWVQAANPAEIRETAHRALRIPLVFDPHDAFLHLKRDRNASSVPYLIWGLRWQPHNPPGDRMMVCTKEHCLAALRRITGVDAGLNYEDWRDWYNKSRR